ncbi:MAG: hypothetical protein MUP68_06550 [Deltaproteobacteria bacterium]|nr:hypothetical protein [Deltaproteobacteria bacterium]
MNEIGARTLAYLRGEKDLFQERERVAQVRRQLGASGLAFWMSETQRRKVTRFWQVVSLLQEDSRMALWEMSKRLNIPVSTLFDTQKEVQKYFHFTIVLKDFPVGKSMDNGNRVVTSAEQEAHIQDD